MCVSVCVCVCVYICMYVWVCVSECLPYVQRIINHDYNTCIIHHGTQTSLATSHANTCAGSTERNLRPNKAFTSLLEDYSPSWPVPQSPPTSQLLVSHPGNPPTVQLANRRHTHIILDALELLFPEAIKSDDLILVQGQLSFHTEPASSVAGWGAVDVQHG